MESFVVNFNDTSAYNKLSPFFVVSFKFGFCIRFAFTVCLYSLKFFKKKEENVAKTLINQQRMKHISRKLILFYDKKPNCFSNYFD